MLDSTTNSPDSHKVHHLTVIDRAALAIAQYRAAAGQPWQSAEIIGGKYGGEERCARLTALGHLEHDPDTDTYRAVRNLDTGWEVR